MGTPVDSLIEKAVDPLNVFDTLTSGMGSTAQSVGNLVKQGPIGNADDIKAVAGSKLGSVVTGRAVLQGGIKEQDMESARTFDVFGSPATAGTKMQTTARAAAIIYGAAAAAGALSGSGIFGSGTATGADVGLGASEFGAAETFTADSLASNYLGTEAVASTSQDVLLADAGTSMTDVGPGLLEGAGTQTATAAETGAFDMGQFAVQDMGGAPASASAKSGVLNGAMQWMGKNPLPATIIGTQLAGGVIGGIGQAKLQEDRQDHERQLLEQRLEDQQALEEWKRRFTQSGSYFDATPKLKPAADTTLRRPDGTPVYGPNGLISSTMRG